MMGFGMFGGGILWLLVLAGLVLGVVWIARNTGDGAVKGSQKPGPEDIVRERYARGEMSREEYQEAMATLEAETITN